MRVLICGGRDYGNPKAEFDRVWNTLSKLNHERTVSVLIEGGAPGADAAAGMWADITEGVEHLIFRADWKAHGLAAGPIRNQRMIEEGKPDLVIAFPGKIGTADMVERAGKAGIAVIQIENVVSLTEGTF